MKRWIPLLILMLLALLMPAALGEGNRLLALDEEYLSGLMSDGNTLYILGDMSLYTWREGQDAPIAWESALRLPSGEDADAGEEDIYFYELRLYADGDGAHALRERWSGEDSEYGVQLLELVFTDHGTVEAANVRPLEMPREATDAEYWSLQGLCAHDGILTLLGDSSDGMMLVTLDPDDAGASRVQSLDGWDYQLISTPQDVFLAEYNYQSDEPTLTLSRVGEDGTPEALCSLPAAARGFAADPLTGTVYVTLEGKACVVDVETGELGEPFASVPLDPDRAAALGDGRGYAVLIDNRLAVLDPSAQVAEGNLLTISGEYADIEQRNAIMDYSVEHPEIAPVMSNDYMDYDRILEAMLTQSAEPDIYLLYTQDPACQAILDRGYALSLEDSEALNALVERMYLGIRQAVTRNGALMAVPVRETAMGMGLSETLLERMGLSIDDVPKDWLGFLDFLEEQIKPNLEALGEDGHFTYDDMTDAFFRQLLRNNALNGYISASAAAGLMPDYGNPYLLELLERLDGMDFTEYGLLPAEDGEDGYGYGIMGGDQYLIQLDMSYDFSDAMVEGTPLPLGFGDDLPGVLPLDLEVALVNPFSTHADEAVAFLEAMAEKLPQTTLYAFCPDLNEPLQRPDVDRVTAEWERDIARAREEIEEAEAIDRQELEDNLREWEQAYQQYLDEGSWLISPKKLAWYRANGDSIAVAVPSWFDKDSTGEAWDLFNQYDEGMISAREFLEAVNRKARMMELEG